MPKADFLNLKFKDKIFSNFKWFLNRLKNKENYFITEKYRLLYPSKVDNAYKDYTKNIAILLQGPLIKENNFTLETIKLYKKNFPNAKIVLSTWDTEKEACDSLGLNDLGIKVIYGSIIYKDYGFGSTNLQIQGNKNGLAYISQQNIKYTVKTRTDQRYSNPYLLSFLLSIKDLFPLEENKGLQQAERLVCMSFDSFTYRLYGLSDMFLFGNTKDVSDFWDCEFDMRTFKDFEFNISTQRLYSKQRLCEVYFMTEFLERKGVKINWTLAQSWEEIAKRFVVVDSYNLEFFWPKYSHLEDRFRLETIRLNESELTFSIWLRIFNKQMLCDENILDKQI